MTVKGRHKRRGKSVLLWTIALFWLVQFGVGLAMDYLGTRLRFPHLYQQVERALDQPRMPTILCLGSSRFGTGLNEEEMTRVLRAGSGDPAAWVFNGSIPGGDLLVSERLLEQLLDEGVKPKLILLELCPEVVNHRNDWLQMHVHRQFTWRELTSYAGELLRTGHMKHYVKTRLAPLAAYRQTLQGWLGQCLEQLLDGGGGAAEGLRQPRWQTAADDAPRERVIQDIAWDSLLRMEALPGPELVQRTQAGLHATQRCLRKYHSGGNSGRALERILERCRREGIAPVLIGVPVASAHRALYTPAIEGDFQAYVQRMCGAYGCRFLDYRGAVPDGLFVDNHHVGDRGRLLLSQKLAGEITAFWECP